MKEKGKKTSVGFLAAEGLIFWEVYFKASYYDNDPRMPGTVPVDRRFYVIADSHAKALKKAEPLLKELREKKEYENKEITVNPVALENLIPTRNSSGDGRLGWHSITPLSEVKLSLEKDRKGFRLAVCLIKE